MLSPLEDASCVDRPGQLRHHTVRCSYRPPAAETVSMPVASVAHYHRLLVRKDNVW